VLIISPPRCSVDAEAGFDAFNATSAGIAVGICVCRCFAFVRGCVARGPRVLRKALTVWVARRFETACESRDPARPGPRRLVSRRIPCARLTAAASVRRRCRARWPPGNRTSPFSADLHLDPAVSANRSHKNNDDPSFYRGDESRARMSTARFQYFSLVRCRVYELFVLTFGMTFLIGQLCDRRTGYPRGPTRE